MPEEARSPIAHFRRSAADAWNLLEYVERKFGQVDLYQQCADRHVSRLNRMVLADLIENFERFLKELAAICVDNVASFVADNRFNKFRITGSALAAHFGADTLGKSLCESDTWLDCNQINDRFRSLLAEPYEHSTFLIFPSTLDEEKRALDTLSLVWQIRHTIVHNVGVITKSDAIKLGILTKNPVSSPRVLTATRDDVRYVKRFLDETAQACNNRVGNRLAQLLTSLHSSAPTLFDARELADRISRVFGVALTIDGEIGSPAP